MVGGVAVGVVVEPPSSQFFKYSSFSVSCGGDGQEEDATGWTVMKRMTDGEVGPALKPLSRQGSTHNPSLQVGACGPSCVVVAAFPATDSGQYWCESGTGSSSAVNISVTGTSKQSGDPAARATGSTLRGHRSPLRSPIRCDVMSYQWGLL